MMKSSAQIVTIELIAKVAYNVNKAYCESIGDYSHLEWKDAHAWQKESVFNRVRYHLSLSRTKPSDSHENWMKEKIAAGWKYGKEKNPDKKTHPCLVPFDKLPKEQQVKDVLFVAVVKSFK